MRIIKSMIGWLCSLSLVGVVISLVCLAFLFMNAKVYRLPQPDPSAIIPILAKGGLQEADSAVLETYVNPDKLPGEELALSRWEAMGMFFSLRHIPLVELSWHVSEYKPRNVEAAALMDSKGRVVAAYPKVLVGRQFPLNGEPVARIEDGPRDNWDTHEFFRPEIGYADVLLNKVRGGDGKVIGALATVRSPHLTVRVLEPSDTEVSIVVFYCAIVFFVAYWLQLAAWTALDAAWRGMERVPWGFLVLLTNLIGWQAYLIARRPRLSCPNCGEPASARYVRCPVCGVSLITRCPVCGARMKPGWKNCPVCSRAPSSRPEAARTSPATEAPAGQLTEGDLAGRSAIVVKTVDAESLDPIVSAHVTIGGPSTIGGFTDPNGSFEAFGLVGGSYTLTAEKDGYEQSQIEIEFAQDSHRMIQLELRALPGSISGSVVISVSQEPVAGARVYVDSNRVDRSSLADAEGAFVLLEIPRGPYAICAEAEGFAAQTKLAEIQPGQQASVDFALEPTSVADRSGQVAAKENPDDAS